MNLRRFIPSSRIASNQPNRGRINVQEDDVYRILSAHRRRLVLSILDERGDGQISISELTRVIASRETGAEPLGVSEDALERIYVAVTHSHLPVLEAANVVEWDRDASLVRSGRSVSALAEVIRDIEERTG